MLQTHTSTRGAESPAASNPPATPGLAAIHAFDVLRVLGPAGRSLFAQVALHAQLMRVEWAEEKNRLLKMLWVTLLGFACLICVMLLGGALVVALCWQTAYQLPAAIAVIALYAWGTNIAWRRLQALAALGEQSFAATREEFAADLALLKSRL